MIHRPGVGLVSPISRAQLRTANTSGLTRQSTSPKMYNSSLMYTADLHNKTFNAYIHHFYVLGYHVHLSALNKRDLVDESAIRSGSESEVYSPNKA